jgi:transcriptional regulator
VPTWNYLAVHVQGELSLIEATAEKDALLKRLIGQHEPGYAEHWRGLPEDFQHKLLGAIVGFRIRVRRWEAKAKLSQNRSALERVRIVAQAEAGTPRERELAQWMRRLGLAGDA